jgi:murein DD-endopeptidase MepM/ murein hydrolase activator NlpD
MSACPRRPLWSALVLLVLLTLLTVSGAAGAAEPDPVGVWPLQPQPEVVAGFDPPDDPWGSGHRGVDLLGFRGQSVHTALAGRVSFAGLLAGRGVVVVDHGETRTTYEPVTATVAVGDVLPLGAVIGELHASGSHCPPQACLHWGWLRGEVYLDPLGIVSGGPVRLLPLWRDDPLPLAGAATNSLVVGPYAAVLVRLELFTRSTSAGRLGRAPPYARGCACW